jgi:ABC-2 type transport system ATP-binding protein
MTSMAEQTLAAREAAEAAALEAVQPIRLLLREVTKTWPRQTVPVLDHVELDVEAGKLVSIVGRNGAGKTTLLRIVSGLIFADSGTVRLDGLDPKKHRREYQRRIGFLSASYGGLYARLSVRQHLDLWARLAFVPRQERRAAIEATIDRFDLRELLASRRVDRLSMGQRQRVRLAMAFLHEPKLVLLDEPWNSLDEEGREVLTTALRDVVAGGGSAICCSPTGTEIGPHAQATYVVSDGKVDRR